MTFAAGTRFGVYEITGLIGVGGMGEVYRASDAKLGREVAIKTLPSELANDRDRLARFEREAKLLASLNHPHIASVYGAHEHEGVQFLAMELVEGETLDRYLERTSLSVEEILPLALQIAEALEAAHEKGVVHRDLKPANIMVGPGGRIKLLDFGLAKAFAHDPNKTTVGQSPALSLAMTQAGLLLGTAGYMSPEQASGQSSDQRADVWSFGVVLYEMLAGLPPFGGESTPHVLASVLKSEPDWSRLPRNLHPRLKFLLDRCLTKKPRNRLQSIADARVEIEAILGHPKGVKWDGDEAGTNARTRGFAWRIAVAVGLGALLVGGAAGWMARRAPEPVPGGVVRFTIPLPAEQTFTSGPLAGLAVSPDGKRIAYVANGQIFVRELDQSAAYAVPGTSDPSAVAVATPVFSPDGQWLAYVHVASAAGPWLLKRVPISGGSPVTIHEGKTATDFQQGLTWPTPDTMLFSGEAGIFRIPASGGESELLVARRENERLFSPQLLPGGKAVLFTRVVFGGAISDILDAGQVAVQSIGGDDRTIVLDGGSAGRYLPSGHLVYANRTALFAAPFDLATRTVTGGSVPVVEGVRRAFTVLSDTADFAVSDSGTLLTVAEFATDQGRIETTVAWVDREGREVAQLPVRPDDYTMVRIAPDGKKIALVTGSGLSRPRPPAIWIFDRDTENLSLLTGHPAGDDAPLWSSDGRRIFFRSFRGGVGTGVWAIELETGETALVGQAPDYPYALPWTISPDDRVLGIVNVLNLADFNLATLSTADGTFTRLLHEKVNESEPSFSPDGAWVAYAGSAGDPKSEISIRAFPAVTRTLIPVGAGQSPVFSRDGSELYFFDGRGISAVAISYQPTLRVGPPRRLFESAAYQWAVDGRAWDADPSGQQFLMIRAPTSGLGGAARPPQQIDVVLNWFEELQSRVPVQ